jgi:hypothetical protein
VPDVPHGRIDLFDVRKKIAGFLTYHGFLIITSLSRIISRDNRLDDRTSIQHVRYRLLYAQHEATWVQNRFILGKYVDYGAHEMIISHQCGRTPAAARGTPFTSIWYIFRGIFGMYIAKK